MRFLEEHSGARARLQEKMWVIGSTRAHSFAKLLHRLKRYGRFESSRIRDIGSKYADLESFLRFLIVFYNIYIYYIKFNWKIEIDEKKI